MAVGSPFGLEAAKELHSCRGRSFHRCSRHHGHIIVSFPLRRKRGSPISPTSVSESSWMVRVSIYCTSTAGESHFTTETTERNGLATIWDFPTYRIPNSQPRRWNWTRWGVLLRYASLLSFRRLYSSSSSIISAKRASS